MVLEIKAMVASGDGGDWLGRGRGELPGSDGNILSPNWCVGYMSTCIY